MKTIKSVAFILLQLAVLSCSARSGRRSNPGVLENVSLLGSSKEVNGSLTAGPADPSLKILSRVPYDEKIGRLTLRITALRAGPFISSYNILPCMVDALSTSFNAIWNVVDQHPNLDDNRYWCSENGLTLQVLSRQPPLKGMEYSDLVNLARMLLNFQQEYRLPGIEFQYLENGQITGTGDLDWNKAANELNQTLQQE